MGRSVTPTTAIGRRPTRPSTRKMKLYGHPWKTVFGHIGRHFLEKYSPESVPFNTLSSDLEPHYTDRGREWAIYAIGDQNGNYWKATFLDDAVCIELADGRHYDIHYADVARVVLPNKLDPLERVVWNGRLIIFQSAEIIGHTGTHYEVRATATPGGR